MRGFSELHELQAAYERFVTLTVSKDSARQYAKKLGIFFKHFPEKRTPDEFTRPDIEDYKVIRLREGVKPATINYELAITGGFWKWMMDLGRAAWNPITGVKRLRTKEPPKKSLTIAEQLSLAKGCFCDHDRMLLALALTTGLRAATMSQLTWSMVSFDESRLIIPAEIMKAGRNHEIPLQASTLDLLRRMRDERTSDRVFGKYARTPQAITYRWNAICRRAGVSLRGIRTARRSFATTLLRGGADLKLVQDLLGHRNIATTSRYLTPADHEETKRAIDRLPSVLEVSDEKASIKTEVSL